MPAVLFGPARLRMFPAMLRAPRLLLALVLCASPLAFGCSGGGSKFAKVEAPAAGVSLRYDLSPGQVYKGSVRRSETERDSRSSVSSTRGFSFDLLLTVRGPDSQHGGSAVTARFSNVSLRWSLPPGTPISLGEFTANVTKQLQGLEVDFSVDETGKILHLPELPEELAPEMRFVLQESLDTLETAFLMVPSQPLKAGDQWQDDKKRGRPGKLGRYLEGSVKSKLEGFYRAPDGQTTLAKLVTTESEKEVTTTKAGSHEVNKETTTEAYFATDQRYLFSYVSEQQIFDPGNTTTFAKTEVSWTKPASQTTAPSNQVVQDISDPCHPDYVGAEECTSTPPPAGEDAGEQPPASSQPPAASAPPPAG